MKDYLIITKNTNEVRSFLNTLASTELVASQPDFMVWVWHSVQDADLAAVQANADYVGQVALSA